MYSSTNQNGSIGGVVAETAHASHGPSEPQALNGSGDQQMALNIKNQRKAAMAARMRPRSQTGNSNAKNANLF